MKLPGWGLPLVEVQALATAIRRAARLLWSLHLCFAEGFDTVSPSCFLCCLLCIACPPASALHSPGWIMALWVLADVLCRALWRDKWGVLVCMRAA